jgi:hypothetical protein
MSAPTTPAQVSTEQLLEPLRQQLRAFEQAMREMETPAETELLHLGQTQQPN